jgi:hypothetical protein
MFLPLGSVDLTVKRIGDDVLLLSWTDAIFGEILEAEASIEEVAKWEHDGGLPADLPVRRWTMAETGERIAALEARQDELAANRDRLVSEFPALKSQKRP